MKRAAELDLLVAVHAETNELIGAPSRHGTVRDFLASRPIETELSAIRTALDLAQETDCRLHIVHVSCGRGVALVAEARANGVDVTCETCPHYLFLTDEDMVRLGAVAKCAPPLRPRNEQDDLWKHLSDVATVGSDHSPLPGSMKQDSNFFRVWGGISGCQHLLPLLLDAKEKISPPEIVRLTSSGVAERFRISQKRGLEVGKDADFTLVDLNAEETVRADSLQYRHRHTPYLGRHLRGRIVRTVLRGQTIFDNGSLGARPAGRLVRPESQPSL